MKVVVYTAICGGKDSLKNKQNTKGADFVAFLDQPQNTSTWEVRPIDVREWDSNRNAKIYKVLPHKYFPDYDYSLWIDGSIELKVPVQDLIKKYLKKSNWAQFKHPTRNNVFAEGTVCAQMNLDNPLIIQEQLTRYLEDGYPEGGYEMGECTILLRKHNEPDVIKLNEAWWDEIEHGSKRDQLSFGYLQWKMKPNITWMKGSVEKIKNHEKFMGNEYFTHTKHLR